MADGGKTRDPFGVVLIGAGECQLKRGSLVQTARGVIMYNGLGMFGAMQ